MRLFWVFENPNRMETEGTSTNAKQNRIEREENQVNNSRQLRNPLKKKTLGGGVDSHFL